MPDNDLLIAIATISLALGLLGGRVLPWIIQRIGDSQPARPEPKMENGNVMKAEIAWLKSAFAEFRAEYKQDQTRLWGRLDVLVTEEECKRRHDNL